jgi:hypothetical protein
VEAYVIVGRRVYVFQGQATDAESLRAFLEGIDYEERFTSSLYDYSIEAGPAWTAHPATKPWPGFGNRTLAPEADVFQRPAIRFSIVATTVPGGTSVDEWLTTAPVGPSPRVVVRDGAPWCDRSTWTFPETGSPAFTAATIAGQPARLRDHCGVIDAVVVANGRGYLIRMQVDSGENPANALSTFRDIADTIQFGAAAEGPAA